MVALSELHCASCASASMVAFHQATSAIFAVPCRDEQTRALFLQPGAFSSEARREAAREGAPPIELVDGDKLMRLFEDLGLD